MLLIIILVFWMGPMIAWYLIEHPSLTCNPPFVFSHLKQGTSHNLCMINQSLLYDAVWIFFPLWLIKRFYRMLEVKETVKECVPANHFLVLQIQWAPGRWSLVLGTIFRETWVQIPVESLWFLWPWSRILRLLSLGFLILKIGILIVACIVVRIRYYRKNLPHWYQVASN